MIWVFAFLLGLSLVLNLGLAALYGDYRRRLEIALVAVPCEPGSYIAIPVALLDADHWGEDLQN